MTKKTDKECSNENCESNYHRDGAELFCKSCGHTPDPPTDVALKPPWQSFMDRDEEHGRVRFAGGYHDAYSGEGEYCYESGYTF